MAPEARKADLISDRGISNSFRLVDSLFDLPDEKLTPVPPPELQGLSLYETDCYFIKHFKECMRSWKMAFPRLDVLAEIKKAHAWEVTNPSRRKENRPRFINNWLSRANSNLPAIQHTVNQMVKPTGLCDKCRGGNGFITITVPHERYGPQTALARCSH